MYGSPGVPGYQPTPPQSSYMPLAPVEETSATQSPVDIAPPPQSALNGLFYQPQGQDAASQSPYYQGPPGMPQSESNGYMPPSASANAYEPPSHTPAMASAHDESQESVEEEASKPKKSFMEDEDDDDLAAQAAALQKAENDRKADEAFRKAAEEDGMFQIRDYLYDNTDLCYSQERPTAFQEGMVWWMVRRWQERSRAVRRRSHQGQAGRGELILLR